MFAFLEKRDRVRCGGLREWDKNGPILSCIIKSDAGGSCCFIRYDNYQRAILWMRKLSEFCLCALFEKLEEYPTILQKESILWKGQI